MRKIVKLSEEEKASLDKIKEIRKNQFSEKLRADTLTSEFWEKFNKKHGFMDYEMNIAEMKIYLLN